MYLSSTKCILFLIYFLFATVQPTTEPVKPTMDPCFDQSCTYHAECIVEQGLPKCVCPSNCPNTSSAICGSDGITYGNDCYMRRASCNKQLTITISSRGSCGKFTVAVLLLHHNIPHHTIPYHITPYHITPYHTTPYHITPYHNLT